MHDRLSNLSVRAANARNVMLLIVATLVAGWSAVRWGCQPPRDATSRGAQDSAAPSSGDDELRFQAELERESIAASSFPSVGPRVGTASESGGARSGSEPEPKEGLVVHVCVENVAGQRISEAIVEVRVKNARVIERPAPVRRIAGRDGCVRALLPSSALDVEIDAVAEGYSVTRVTQGLSSEQSRSLRSGKRADLIVRVELSPERKTPAALWGRISIDGGDGPIPELLSVVARAGDDVVQPDRGLSVVRALIDPFRREYVFPQLAPGSWRLQAESQATVLCISREFAQVTARGDSARFDLDLSTGLDLVIQLHCDTTRVDWTALELTAKTSIRVASDVGADRVGLSTSDSRTERADDTGRVVLHGISPGQTYDLSTWSPATKREVHKTLSILPDAAEVVHAAFWLDARDPALAHVRISAPATTPLTGIRAMSLEGSRQSYEAMRVRDEWELELQPNERCRISGTHNGAVVTRAVERTFVAGENPPVELESFHDARIVVRWKGAPVPAAANWSQGSRALQMSVLETTEGSLELLAEPEHALTCHLTLDGRGWVRATWKQTAAAELEIDFHCGGELGIELVVPDLAGKLGGKLFLWPLQLPPDCSYLACSWDIADGLARTVRCEPELNWYYCVTPAASPVVLAGVADLGLPEAGETRRRWTFPGGAWRELPDLLRSHSRAVQIDAVNGEVLDSRVPLGARRIPSSALRATVNPEESAPPDRIFVGGGLTVSVIDTLKRE